MLNQVMIQALDTQGYPITNLKESIKLYINSPKDESPKIDCTQEKDNGIYVFDIDNSINIFSRIFVRLTHDIDIKKGENKITYLKEPHFLHPTCAQINILQCMIDTSKIIPYTFTIAKGTAFIGVIKAYKANDLDKCHCYDESYNDTFDNTLMSYKDDWQNEIYTIDTNQTIRLQAFIVKSSMNKILNENLQGVSLSQIKWGYKIISSTLKTHLNSYNKINKEKDIIPFDNKIGTNIWLNLSEIKQDFIANEHIFDNSGNNIMIFAYTKEKDKRPRNLNYRQPPLPTRIKTIQCIELKIIKSRFHLRYHDNTLALLENERVMLSLPCTHKLNNFLAKYTNTQDFKPNYAHKMQITNKDSFIDDFKANLSNNKADILNHIDTDCLYLEFIENKEITIEIIRKYEDLNLTMSNFRILINGNENPKCKEHTNTNDSNTISSCKSCQTLQTFARLDNHYFLERSGPDCITPDLELRIPEGIYSISWHKSDKYLNPEVDEYVKLLQTYTNELGLKDELHKDSSGKKLQYKPLLNLHNRYLHKDRHILIHSGGEIKDSSGCLLIGDKLDIDDKGNIVRITRNHTHKIASDFMTFLMQRDTKDSNTNKFRYFSAKNNNKIEIPNINIVIRNEFGNVEKSKRVRAIDKLFIRFNGKELQILENGEITNKAFTISPFSLSNPKELVKESKDYILDIKNIPAFIATDYKYTFSMQDENNNIATITNKNTKNIINAEIFLDDMFADFARILSSYKATYNANKVRVEVGYGFALAHSPLADLIGQAESQNKYTMCNHKQINSKGKEYYGVKDLKELTMLPLSKIIQKQQTKEIFAAGRFQVVKTTLLGAKNALNLNENDLFNEEMQDRIFEEYLIDKKRPDVIKYLKGNGDIDKAAYALAKEFASIGVKNGWELKNYPKGNKRISNGKQSFYENIGGNKMIIAYESVIKALKETKRQMGGY